VALRWCAIGVPLVLLYFYVLFRLHRGNVRAPLAGEGY
jgi:hypothetical protein